MSDTATRLENEIEARRAGVAQTLDELRHSVSADHLMTEVSQFLGVDDLGGTVRAAGHHIRQHPVAYGLIGAGVAWMILSSRSTPGRGTHLPGQQAVSRSMRNLGQSIGDTVSSTVGSLTGEAGSRLGDAAAAASDRVHNLLSPGGRPWTDRVADQPLVAGAGAVLVGAILGAALPHTRAEDRVLGPSRRMLMDEAKAAGQAMMDKARDVAEQTLDTAVQTAREEGLVPPGDATIADRVERVAAAALDEAKSQIAQAADQGMESGPGGGQDRQRRSSPGSGA